MAGTVTYCVTWTSGGIVHIHCEDVLSTDSSEAITRERALRKARKKMDEIVDGQGPFPPTTGTTLAMERFVGNVGTPWAATSVGSDWPASFALFVQACMPDQ